MLEFSLEVVRHASELTLQLQKELVSVVLDKSDRSPVTVADLAVQAYVAAKLEEYTPEIPLIGEESSDVFQSEEGKKLLPVVTKYVQRFLPGKREDDICRWINRGQEQISSSEKFWTLDPVDGTKGFLRGQQYAVALALVENGVVKLGVLGCPSLSVEDIQDGVLAYACREQGAWITPLRENSSEEGKKGNFSRRLHVSQEKEISQARILRSVESGHTNVSQLDVLMQKMKVCASPVQMDSQAKYVILADGKGDLLFRLLSAKMPDYEEKIWDQAAGSILLEEAGGKITDLDGKKLDFTQGRTLKKNRGICASNNFLHDAAIQALQELRSIS
ncbi:MAG: 3'(2'),5'-bisphosphate nucleotidase [Planctomycetia bacterium]|nr:3'(2'),5'-bisphosphate nucleotidase [Planctomycetia bacterium]